MKRLRHINRILLLFLCITPALTIAKEINPYRDADRYINTDYTNEVDSSISQSTDAGLIGRMKAVRSVPTAIWLDRIAAIEGGAKNNNRKSLEQHLLAALEQQRESHPMLVEIVLYNLPNRDCAALSSNGTLDAKTGGLDIYQHDYIDVITDLLADPRFSSLRFSLFVEPDSLPNMVTNKWHPKCLEVFKNRVYEKGIGYAIRKLSELDNVYLYLDVGHSGWLGWENVQKKVAAYYALVVTRAKARYGLFAVDGFVTNISGSTPTEEPWLADPNRSLNNQPLKSADFYQWNPAFDEKDFIEAMQQRFINAGFSGAIRFVVDTSRNGWGGAARPVKASTAATVNHFVEASRIDQRLHRGNWCNPTGAGLGERPTADPFGPAHPIAAFAWIKPPGESDGISDPSQKEADAEGKKYDPMCDPNYIGTHGPYPTNKPTGALPNAPAAGHWFPKQFEMLVQNAWPPISGNGNQMQ